MADLPAALVPRAATFAQLFDQAPGFVAVFEGPSHVFVYANSAYRRLVGERELLGLTVRQAVPEVEGQGFFELLDAVLMDGKPVVRNGQPVQLRRQIGGPLENAFVDFVYQPMSGPDGRPVGIFCQGQDITEHLVSQRAAEERAGTLDEQSRIFDTVLSSIADFAYILDLGGRFTYANKALLQLWNIPLAQAVGKSFSDLGYEPALAAKLHREMAEVVRTGEPYVGQTQYTSRTGNVGWYEYILTPVVDAQGAVIFVAGSTRDITGVMRQREQALKLVEAERAARTEAERVSRMKDEFLATLSHELRTPLNAIVGWAEMLKAGRLGPEKTREAAVRIDRNARVQARLISDLLDVNAIVSGKLRLNLERISLGKQLTAALEEIGVEAGVKLVQLVGPSAALDAVTMLADPFRLQQILWNLLANAVKFTPAGGTVRLDADVVGETASIVISDTGRGIPESFLPRLFERFTQADSSLTRRYSGLGLGLSIARSLAELHGGKIEASSPGIDLGSTFRITLPLRRDEEAPVSEMGGLNDSEAAHETDAAALDGVTVLVVDDDDEGRQMTRQILEMHGCQVIAAASAKEALAWFGEHRPALIVCDIGMPDMDGYEFMRRVRASEGPRRRVAALALTAFARPEDQARAAESGFDCHVAKPVKPRALVESCVRCLAAVRTETV
ncbi:MAG: PAS domain-containing protein [Pseudomonadota bacterium]|nr:PAS domain-containing protein [Pseudomonadota bacterium]